MLFLEIGFGLEIITRDKRGANEEIRYVSNEEYEILKQQEEKYLKELSDDIKEKEKIKNSYLIEKYPYRIKIDKIIQEENGKKLRKPRLYHYNKTRIIIHHTASEASKLNTKELVEKHLRGIYRYHTITKGWGDLGYNYVIGPDGTIYEGRYGGDSVVGSHAKRNNVDSIGIALVGNFEYEYPTESQINSLIELITYLSKKYNINPNEKVYWHKESQTYPFLKDILDYTIVGHKDVGYTLCPGKNLYELLPYIREKVSQKLGFSKISYNKINLNINKIFIGKTNGKIYYEFNENPIKCYSETINIISCYKNNDELVLEYNNLKTGRHKIIIETENNIYEGIFPILNEDQLDNIKLKRKLKFNVIKPNKINRMENKIYINEIKQLESKPVRVLLYELSFYTGYKIKCVNECIINTNVINLKLDNFSIEKNNKIILKYNTNSLDLDYIEIIGHIIIENYDRKSFSGIAWNEFKGKIIIKKEPININGKIENIYAIINEVNFEDYLKGIAEGNDVINYERTKTLAILSKMYILFYQKNRHPNIPNDASYNAIDDPRSFQKYVGAGFEKTSKNWLKALEETKNIYIIYNGYIPLLPYFNCSAGFTYSAEEKRGWSDTPWLVSKIDFGKCKYFNGHGVGLSGNGAEFLAKLGMNYKDILRYYYEGIEIIKIN